MFWLEELEHDSGGLLDTTSTDEVDLVSTGALHWKYS